MPSRNTKGRSRSIRILRLPIGCSRSPCVTSDGDEALIHGDQAERLSPRDLLARGNAGVSNNVRAIACFVARRYRAGIDFARKAIVEEPEFDPRV